MRFPINYPKEKDTSERNDHGENRKRSLTFRFEETSSKRSNRCSTTTISNAQQRQQNLGRVPFTTVCESRKVSFTFSGYKYCPAYGCAPHTTERRRLELARGWKENKGRWVRKKEGVALGKRKKFHLQSKFCFVY